MRSPSEKPAALAGSSMVSRWLYWSVVCLAVHLSARAIQYLEFHEFYPQPEMWLRGLASDASLSVALGGVFMLVGFLHRWVAWLALALWCVVLAGNYEYISDWKAHASIFDVALLGEKAFLRGSVFILPLFLQAAGLFAVALLAGSLLRRMRWPRARIALPLVLLGMSAVFLPLRGYDDWIQQHLVEDNARQLYAYLFPMDDTESPQARAKARRLFHTIQSQDLSGERRVPAAPPGTNVLMLTIEGLSEAIASPSWMPYLHELSAGNLHYTQILNPNIVTVRGLYALLCGEMTYFDRFGHDRAIRHIKRKKITCLPSALRRHGYQTVFMQNADLKFQSQAWIMPLMGFEASYGNDELTEGNRFSYWGIDDPSLFAYVKKEIEKLETHSKAPWLVTVMTTGTHHPYSIPDDFEPGEKNRRKRSHRYTDQALKSLITWLEETGRLEKTLVVIAGDESRDIRYRMKNFGKHLAHNHGFVTLLSPGKHAARIDALFSQSDVPLTILDHLGMTPPKTMPGRSLLRSYSTFRPLVFADYSQKSFRLLEEKGMLTNCIVWKWECRTFQLQDLPLFDENQSFNKQAAADSDMMRALARFNSKHWSRPMKTKRLKK